MKKGVMLLMSFTILSMILLVAALSWAEKPPRPKLEDMAREELLSRIYEGLKDEDVLDFIPILDKAKDSSGAENYIVKIADKGERRIEELDKQELMQLLGRIILVTETREEIVKEIRDYLDDEELLGMVPGLGIVKDKAKGEYFTFRLGDEPARRLDDLDKKDLIKLRGMVIQGRTILQSQRIQRQLEIINRSVQQNVQAAQRAQQIQSQVPKFPNTPGVTNPTANTNIPPGPPRVYVPPQPPRREGR